MKYKEKIKTKNKNKIYYIMLSALIIGTLILISKFLLISVYYSEGFKVMASQQSKIVIDNPMPRGEIFDRKNRLIVGNKEEKNLYYISDGNMDDEQEWKIAKEIAQNINCAAAKDDIHDTDYKDIYIRENLDKINDKIKSKVTKSTTKEEASVLRREAVTQDDIEQIKKQYGEETLDIKIKMNLNSQKPLLLAENLSTQEQYYIQSKIGSLGGAFILSDWERDYRYGNTLSSLLGGVGDIPKEELNKYQALGYSANEQVGTSYIEKNLESILHSKNQKIEIFYDDAGNINNYKILDKGKEGSDIKLTIDIKVQEQIEKILKQYLKQDNYKLFTNTYASVVDPHTGQIIALGGIYNDKNKYYENSIGEFTTAYEAGSIVKPAVLSMGYAHNKWKYNKVIMDQPIDMGGGVTKASYHNYGSIDEYKAIQVSSNVYFYDMLMQIAGIDYNNSDAFPAKVDEKYFIQVRNDFAQYGLGSLTGIGFDNEIAGMKSTEKNFYQYLDLANGQYDTYTPLQMTQYVSVLANQKQRMKMNYLYSINEPGEMGKLGDAITIVQPTVLNEVDVKAKDMEHIHETMAMPSKSGGTTAAAADSRYNFGSKSGTAESYCLEPGKTKATKTDISSFISYAPYKNPKVALSVLFPCWTPDGEVSKANAANAGGDIMDVLYKNGYIQ